MLRATPYVQNNDLTVIDLSLKEMERQKGDVSDMRSLQKIWVCTLTASMYIAM